MAARYHPGVIWGPFLLALVLGLVVSAGLYFAYMWPQVEPDDDEDEQDKPAPAKAEPPPEPAAEAKAEPEPETKAAEST